MLRKLSERIHSGQEGFNLIELLVVILIIGILAAIALPAFLGQRQKGQDATAKSNVRNMVSALEACHTANDSYTGCGTSQEVTDSGIATGTGAGQVDLATIASDNYRIVGQSESGNNFTITHPASGALSRTCTSTGQAGCPSSGNW